MEISLRTMFMVVVGVLVTTICTSAFAGGWSGKQVIKNLNYQKDKVVIVKGLYGPWENPNACDNDQKVVLDPDVSLDAYDQAFALLLGAHLTGREINFFLSGCTLIGNKTVPVIKTVTVH